MNFIKEKDQILFLWSGEVNENIEKTVNEIKTVQNVTVNVENIERLQLASYPTSQFDTILLLFSSDYNYNQEFLTHLLKLLKPRGKFIFKNESNSPEINRSNLLLSGFVNINLLENNHFLGEKPNYEIGSAAKLSFGKQAENKEKIAAVWKLNVDDDEEQIDADELLDEEDKVRPSEESLRVCGTTGKRKACKDCSCGLAEELAGENQSKNQPLKTENAKSSCGSCYLGDAFRCASCPYLGMPAFKPGEKVQLSDVQMKADI
uniref:Anamorsin homolog n=1 Tax=Corethrella appendiculata TaxID=1370023 RepID=U5EZP7_9DIPT